MTSDDELRGRAREATATMQELVNMVLDSRKFDHDDANLITGLASKLADTFSYLADDAWTDEARGRDFEIATSVETSAKALISAITKGKQSGLYDTPVFKCLGDYSKCVQQNHSKAACAALLTICVGRGLIPFIHLL